MSTTKDPANYRKLSVPFATKAEADAALEAFDNDLRELRNKHKIPDVTVVTAVSYLEEGGGETQVFGCGHHGETMKAIGMSAFAFGQFSEHQDQVLAQMAGMISKRRR